MRHGLYLVAPGLLFLIGCGPDGATPGGGGKSRSRRNMAW